VSTAPKGDCTICSKPVYGNSDPLSCNAVFVQDRMGPQGQGTYHHLSCQFGQERKKRDAQKAVYKAELWSDYKTALIATVGFLIGWLVKSATL
jgi:hypothetical protein